MIQIIDYGAGNIGSVRNALEKIGQSYEIVDSPEGLDGISKVIFPGVGAAQSAMENLLGKNFIKAIRRLKVPFLGICLGMQLLFDFSEEGNCKCMGLISGRIRKFSGKLKVPQIGWNKVKKLREDIIFRGIADESYFYFVNSYFASVENSLAGAYYEGLFSAVVKKENFYGVQFHPEKSGETGLLLLRNFCELC